MRRVILALACAPAALVALPAFAQYRDGMPPVIEAPVAAPVIGTDPLSPAAFHDAYSRAGRPRLVIFWNRELTDQLATQSDRIVQVERSMSAASAAGISADGRRAGRTDRSDSVETLRVGTREVDGERPIAALTNSTDWAVMSGFNSRLQSAGVLLVDRAVALRALAAASTAEDRQDRQTIETKALADKAEIILTVMQTPQSGTPLGAAFLVEAKRVNSGEILATVSDTGEPPPAKPGRFVAGANGFVREAPRAPTAEEIGRELADRLMARLATNWNAQ
ncbi:MAG TPA: hypothetical protein VN034_07925 [Sphingopyxis sp.]|nr:hypothetical protein [Sphingopyxis sp.]